MNQSHRYYSIFNLPFTVLFVFLLSVASCVCQSQSSPSNDADDISTPIKFTGDIGQWSSTVDKLAQESGIPEYKKTELAINVGLAGTPELQSVMRTRHETYNILSGGEAWKYSAFLDDLSGIHAEAQKLKGNGDHPDGLIKPGEIVKVIEGGIDDLKNLFSGIRLPYIELPDLDIYLANIKLPPSIRIDMNLEDILRALKPALDSLELVFRDVKASLEDFFTSVHDFIQTQLEHLPREIQETIAEYRKFKGEHPYIVAACQVALGVAAVHVILPSAALSVLNTIGFGPTGPIAGSWAALIQSVVYKGGTGGLFSVLQSIAMTAKGIWPIQVFFDLAALAVGAITVMAPAVIKSVVDNHLPPFPLTVPDIGVISSDPGLGFSVPALLNQASSDGLEQWMVLAGEKMTELNVPHVQWLDVVIEAMRKRCEELAGLYVQV